MLVRSLCRPGPTRCCCADLGADLDQAGPSVGRGNGRQWAVSDGRPRRVVLTSPTSNVPDADWPPRAVPENLLVAPRLALVTARIVTLLKRSEVRCNPGTV